MDIWLTCKLKRNDFGGWMPGATGANILPELPERQSWSLALARAAGAQAQDVK